MISSGVRPYRYEGPWPFSGSGVRHIGYSGILFEQAMFALTAEAEIYTASPTRTFTKYVNRSAAISSGFEPKADGTNLSYRGNIHFKNYITDMRSRLSGLFTYIQSDSPYSPSELILDYFRTHTGDNPSGSVGNWVHAVGELGGTSGNLYDIDLREVCYQPYVRVRKYDLSNTSGIRLPFSPIAPGFCSKTGTLVSITSRDLANAGGLGADALFAYNAVNSGYLAVQGDMIVPLDTKLYITITANGLAANVSSTCASILARTVNKRIGSGVGFFIPPTTNVGTGIYGIQLFNTSALIDGYYCPTSGVIGIWPKREDIVQSGYIRATDNPGDTRQYTSGFHIFNTGFWQYTTSGAMLQSPMNGAYLWYRFADNDTWTTTNYGPKRWSDLAGQPALPIIGSNSTLTFFAGITADLGGGSRRFVFSKYLPASLNFSSAYEQTTDFATSTSPPSVDKFIWCYNHSPPSGVNFSNYYIISECAGLSSGPEVYILNTSLENVGAWDTNTNPGGAPICMVNSHLYGFDSTQVSSSGATFVWQHLTFDDPGGTFPTVGAPGANDTKTYTYESRDTVFDNTNNTAALFEPINPNNFSFGGLPFIYDPRGTDLDYGDGSIFVYFSAKPKGEITLRPFLGRMKEGTVASVPVMIIFEFIPLKDGRPSWIYGIN